MKNCFLTKFPCESDHSLETQVPLLEVLGWYLCPVSGER